MKQVYYKCNKCGKLVFQLHGTENELNCCDAVMERVKPISTGIDCQTYQPVCQIEGRYATILVGGGDHPMKSEYPSWLCLETDLGSHYRWLCPEDVAGAGFALSEDEKPERALAYYGTHGLWETDQIRSVSSFVKSN